MYEPKDIVTSASTIHDILGDCYPSQVNKVIDHIDDHCRAWIARSPFIVLSSTDARGRVDVSPKGDPAGFVKVLDRHTLAIPDRPGNRRADTFLNVLENPHVGIMFIVPLRREVVRIGGTAKIARDKDLLQMLAVNGKPPALALVVRVEEAMFHCGKSMIRSGLWQPEAWGAIEGLPSYAQALIDHGKLAYSLAEMQGRITNNEIEHLY